MYGFLQYFMLRFCLMSKIGSFIPYKLSRKEEKSLEQTNEQLIKQLQQVLLNLDIALTPYAAQDARLSTALASIRQSSTISRKEALNRLLDEVATKAHFLESKRSREQFLARQSNTSASEENTPSRSYSSSISVRVKEDANSVEQWTDVAVNENLPVQQEHYDATISLNKIQVSTDWIRIPFQLQIVLSATTQQNIIASAPLFPLLTGVTVSDDLKTTYTLDNTSPVTSSGFFNETSKQSVQNFESVIKVNPTLPEEANVLQLQIKNVCFLPIYDSVVTSTEVMVLDGPWKFELFIDRQSFR